MLKKIKNYVEKYHMIAPGDTIVAGVSGGADSVCLLFVLLELQKEIPFTLSVVHVNHGIRAEAREDAAYVQQLCETQQIAYYLFEADIKALAETEGISEEEAGRNFRYQCFQKVLDEQPTGLEETAAVHNQEGKIAVAHNMGDRAETMLFHLFRGSGLSGLSGIRPVRDRIIRPLLCLERKEIEDFLENRHILYCIDCTNQEDIYTRNRIRHHLLPMAEEINQNAVRHMAEAADSIWEAEEYIRRQTEKLAAVCVTGTSDEVKIELKELLNQDFLIQKRIFMYALEQILPGRKDITAAHISGLMHIAGCQGSREIHLPYGLYGIKRYDKMTISKNHPDRRGLPDADQKDQNRDQKDQSRGQKDQNPDQKDQNGDQKDQNGDQKDQNSDQKDQNSVQKDQNRGQKDQNCDQVTAREISADKKSKAVYPITDSGSLIVPNLGILTISKFSYRKSERIPQKTYTKWFDYDKITASVIFRTRQQGDYLIVNQAGNRKMLKDYLINEKVPREERENLYLLADASHIMWIPGGRISEYYKVTEQTRTILEIKIEPKTKGENTDE